MWLIYITLTLTPPPSSHIHTYKSAPHTLSHTLTPHIQLPNTHTYTHKRPRRFIPHDTPTTHAHTVKHAATHCDTLQHTATHCDPVVSSNIHTSQPPPMHPHTPTHRSSNRQVGIHKASTRNSWRSALPVRYTMCVCQSLFQLLCASHPPKYYVYISRNSQRSTLPVKCTMCVWQSLFQPIKTSHPLKYLMSYA